jgi:hypothetical protein
MELSPTQGAVIPLVMDSEGLLSCSQEAFTGPCHGPDQTSPYHPIIFNYLEKFS